MKIFRRKVQHGSKLGRKIDFPTLNCNVGRFGEHVQMGVYVCRIFIAKKPYDGLFHFGPKLNSKKPVLEIYVHDFNKSIYGQWVSFEVGKKIRNPMTFKHIDDLKAQLEADLQALKGCLQEF